MSVLCTWLEQAWPVLTAVLRRRPQTVPPLSVGGHSEATGQRHLGGGARTVTASAVHRLIRWAPPPPAALAGQGVEPGPRALTPAGELRPPLYQVTKTSSSTVAGFVIGWIKKYEIKTKAAC